MTISEVIQDKYGPQTANGYDRLAYNCFWAYSEAFDAAAQSLFSAWSSESHSKILTLDVGAGTGNGSHSISKKFNNIQSEMGRANSEFLFTLFDQSGAMLSKAQDKLGIRLVDKIVSPIDSFSQKVSTQFQLILSSYFYHNLTEAQKRSFVKSAFEKTLPGGHFILVDRFSIDKKNIFGAPDFLKVYTLKFFNDAKTINPGISFQEVQDEIQKNFEFENDVPGDLLETMSSLRNVGYDVVCPFLSFGIGVIHATKSQQSLN